MRRIKSRTWEGNTAIKLASQVIEEVEGLNDFNVIDWVENYQVDIMKFCAKPQEFTILHEYICDIEYFHLDYIIDKHFPMVAINYLVSLFDYYNIDYSTLGICKYIGKSDDEVPNDDEMDSLEDYAYKLLNLYKEKLLKTIANETFTVLYMNKSFLFEFNSQLATVIKDLKQEKYPDLLKRDGVIKRATYFNTWLKNGVRYRDKERCQICGLQLSRVFQNEISENFDHIIPLELHGSNDPINIQLTCENCNKGKGARHTGFVNSFTPFWDI